MVESACSIEASPVSFLYITTASGLRLALQQLSPVSVLALDLETYCRPQYRDTIPPSDWALDPHSGGISLLSLCGPKGVPYIFDILLLEQQGIDLSELRDFLASRQRLVAHNAKFELKHLYHAFGVWFENFHCTEVLATLIGNATGSKYGRTRGYSLKALLRDWFNVELSGKGKEQVSDWYPRPKERQDPRWQEKLRYAANDVRYLLPLHDALLGVLQAPLFDAEGQLTGYGQGQVVDLEMQMLVVAAEIEYWGLPCQRTLFYEFEQSIADDYGGGEMYRVASEVLETFGYYGEESPYYDYRLPYPDQLRRLNNPQSLRQLIVEFIKKRGGDFHLDNAQRTAIQRLMEITHAYSNDAEEAKVVFVDEEEAANYAFLECLSSEALAETSDIAAKILEYKKLQKQAGMKLSEYIHPLTGCIHASFRQTYAATGRSASSRPNSQNINNRLRVPVALTPEVFSENREAAF